MMHSTHRCKFPAPTRSRTAGIVPLPHSSLRTGDRADPQFDSVVLVDGYQPFMIGTTSAIAVTAYPRAGTGPVEEPPFDSADYLLCQFAIARVNDPGGGLMWLCDVSFELNPDTSYLLGGRIDDGMAQRMRWAEFIVVLDVPTSSAWTMDNVCLKMPNDQEMWTQSPELR